MQEDAAVRRPVLGFAISTMGGRLARNANLCSQLAELAFPAVVVNQHSDLDAPLSASALGLNPEVTTVVNSTERGLSKSRNAALISLDTPWALLCDDDVTLLPEEVVALEDFLATGSFNPPSSKVGAVTTHLMKRLDVPWRAYPSNEGFISGVGWKSLTRIQRINSMELVLHLDALNELEARFDERFGLGAAPTNGGEEVLLLHAILARGGVVLPTTFRPRMHPEESSGQAVNRSTAFTQGAVHRRVFGVATWWLLLASYGLKRLIFSGLGPSDVVRVADYARGGRWASRQA